MSNDPPAAHATAPPPSAAKSGRSELSLRIASGVVMASAALALTLAGGWWFAALVAVGAVIMCWEWGSLVRLPHAATETASRGPDIALGVHAIAALIVIALAMLHHPGWALAVLVAAALVLFALDPARPLSAFGAPYVGVPALVLVWLRAQPELGLAAVLFLFLAVWVTDIGAYAVGRSVGGPKLAPSISPGKTWSGLAGGVVLSAVAAAIFATFVPGASSVRLAALAACLAVMAQAGDLYESALKRRSGLKDASHIIPGHGGLLDRVDGLVAAVALAAILILLLHVDAPARGLVLGH